MIPQKTYCQNLTLAKRVYAVPGSIVECGVWRGGMSAGIAAVLGSAREYHLFDSFQGLPEAKDVDGEAAMEWQKDTAAAAYHDNCSAAPHFAEEAMRLAGASSVVVHQGWFEETIKDFSKSKAIALLRLDGDWYDSTMTCLRGLFDNVAPGGLIVLDDYYSWDGCSRALHDFLSERSATERIRNLGHVCFLVKN